MSLLGPLVSISYLLLSTITLTIGLYARTPASRVWCFPVFVFSTIKSVYSAKHNFGPFQNLAGLWADFMIIYALHALSMLYVEGRTLANPIGVPKDTMSSTLIAPRLWLFAYKHWFNTRHVQTISPFARTQDKSESAKSLRRRLFFLVMAFSKLILYYVIHCHVLPIFFDETIVEFQPDDVSPVQQRLLRRLTEVTPREVVVRTYVSFYWIWEGFLALDGMHAALSIFFVSIGLDTPEEWPPLYGYPTHAVGLKRFWSAFWHAIVVKPYRSYGEFLALRILRLDPRGQLTKTAVAFAIFAISGIVHAAVAWIFEQPAWEWNFWWFVLNFVGCTVETVVMGMVKVLAARLGLTAEMRAITNSWLGAFIGYLYVFAFFFWSVPKWRYPALYTQAVVMEDMKMFVMNLNMQQ